jgi:PadR family transcriptional regulator, regulatory protein PadR
MAADHHKIKVRPRNWLTPVALVILREESSYGYELMERVEEFGFAWINPGTLYKTLRHMENEGLCESEWETSEGGPARRMYAITGAGDRILRLGRRRVSSTRMLWTVSTEPIQLGRRR